jgi:hypothetical protein
LRSGDKDKLWVAMDHIKAAADKGAPVLHALLHEALSVPGSAEWKEWAERDPDAVEWWEEYIPEVAREAVGDRNWRRARDTADETQRVLKEDRRSCGGP